ncbi:hypothetical protein A1O1_07392 [Capronia coronata CBS 617.96]|uniref:Endoglucanase EG-II n=1 Tax=Capronia coronata CBS 617.96 TaxID=1182541 RepID=W9Y283_9EURO|nr:uncharacterized protein A1O1_07392 [Capronia coronata CBS 617.96]EXJ83765.1 hypothetical protein A1O1_07392 [Capronia coronata CBS 617.96]
MATILLYSSRAAAQGCSTVYGQCGGTEWTGSTCCATGSSCQYMNDFYSQCLPYLGNPDCSATYGQCGGIGWTGPSCCQSDWTCQYDNDYYSECRIPVDTSSPTSAASTTTATSTTSSTSTATTPCATNWGQCGGINWVGSTCCTDDWPCAYSNDYYWQCIPPPPASELSSTSTIPSPTTFSTVPTPITSITTTSESSGTATATATTTSSSPSSTSTGTHVRYGGVNIAGFEFGSYDTCGIHTSPPYVDATNYIAQINHFVDDDGLNAFRLPVSWQYLINQYDGGSLASNTLDQTNLATYNTLVQGCLDSGASLCIVDIHNYARFNGMIIGQDGPSAAEFASLWSQLATVYASESRVAFGLMNEPHDESCQSSDGGVIDIDTWAATLQAAVNAIRQAGATSQLILLPGKGWTHSITYLPTNSDGSGPALMGITDPAGGTSKLVFEVHEYLDSNDSGGNNECVTNNIDTSYGRAGLSNLVDYLRSNGRVALLTETGGLNDANCATLLCQELSFLNSNADVFLGYTTWAAGGFDSSYELTETPTLSGNTWSDTLLVQSCVAQCFNGIC